MRVAALDIGDARVGVAISDAQRSLAMPLEVLPTAQLRGDGSSLRRIFEDYEVNHVVVGLPLTLEGEQGPQARHVIALADRILKTCGFLAEDDDVLVNDRVTFYDERLSSVEAKRALSANHTERTMRGKVDKIAASIFLQSYLDSRR